MILDKYIKFGILFFVVNILRFVLFSDIQPFALWRKNTTTRGRTRRWSFLVIDAHVINLSCIVKKCVAELVLGEYDNLGILLFLRKYEVWTQRSLRPKLIQTSRIMSHWFTWKRCV